MKWPYRLRFILFFILIQNHLNKSAYKILKPILRFTFFKEVPSEIEGFENISDLGTVLNNKN